jgi:hypothetical protein
VAPATASGIELSSQRCPLQIQELLCTLRSLVRATEVCLIGVETDTKEAREMIEVAKMLTGKAHRLIDIALLDVDTPISPLADHVA